MALPTLCIGVPSLDLCSYPRAQSADEGTAPIPVLSPSLPYQSSTNNDQHASQHSQKRPRETMLRCIAARPNKRSPTTLKSSTHVMLSTTSSDNESPTKSPTSRPDSPLLPASQNVEQLQTQAMPAITPSFHALAEQMLASMPQFEAPVLIIPDETDELIAGAQLALASSKEMQDDILTKQAKKHRSKMLRLVLC